MPKSSPVLNRFLATLSLIALFLFMGSASADQAFSKRFGTNDYGDVAMIGNQSITCQVAVANCIATQNNLTNLTNNDFVATYVDIDGDSSTVNSSSATFVMPNNSTVLWAGLYWSGYSGANNNGVSNDPRAKVKLKTPGSTAYQTVNAQGCTVATPAQCWFATNANNVNSQYAYQGFADVTTLVAGSGGGTFVVADIVADIAGSNRYGGWSMVIAYRNPNLQPRNIAVFDGFLAINNTTAQNITLNGFLTPPSGAVDTKLGVVGWEGDKPYKTDSMTLTAPAVNTTVGDPCGVISEAAQVTTFANSAGETNNYFDSTITTTVGATVNNTTARNPNYPYSMGTDVHILDFSGKLNHCQTGATLSLPTSSSDVFYLGVVSFSTSTYTPIVAPTVNKTVKIINTDGSTVLKPNSVLEYTILVKNIGLNTASDVQVYDAIPQFTSYKPGSLNIATGANSSPPGKTDGKDGDQAEFEAISGTYPRGRVIFRLGTGATAGNAGTVKGGALIPNQSSTITFQVTVSSTLPANTKIDNTAYEQHVFAALGTTIETAPSNATSVSQGQADLTIYKTDNNLSFQRGSSGLYYLRVQNIGNGFVPDGYTVTVTDTVPYGMSVINASGSGWTCTGSGQSVTCTRADALLSGLVSATTNFYPTISVEVAIVNIPIPGNTLTNTATVSGGNEANTSNNSASDSTNITSLISGIVYEDRNSNGFQDIDEPIIPSVTVQLFNAGGTTVLATSISDATGTYRFPGLIPQAYDVLETVPSGYVVVTPAQLRIDVTNQSNTGANYALFKGAKITGTVFNDDGRSGTTSVVANANNALQNTGETGIDSISVSANGTLTAGGTAVSVQAKTDQTGLYTLWIPSGWSSSISVSHTSNVPTGNNQSGASIVLASVFESAAVRSMALTQVSGTVYTGKNFGLVARSLLQPDQFGSTSSPGSVRYLHFFKPGTLGILTLATSSSGGFNYIFYRDSNCDAVIDVGEHAAPMTGTTITVDATWPRETGGGLKSCGLEVEVLAPAGKAPTMVDIATITGAMVWTNNAAVTDTVRVIDTTKLVGIAGNLQLYKGVRNVTQDTSGGVTTPTYKTSVGGKPGVAGAIGEELEYCISYKNVGTTPVSSMVVTDPIPFFTNFKAGSITLNGTAQADGTTVNDGFITVTVGTVAAGVGGTVCYRVTIK
jgi:uncharacterized repeat protein (TIGR01451 family)